jgi:hypothetical protein
LFKLYFLLATTPCRTDAGEDVRAEEADREDHQGERDDQVHQLRDDLADLEVCRADLDGEGREALAGRRRRGEERYQDTVIQRLEERRHDTSEVKRGREDDDILSIEHLLREIECFSANVIMRIQSEALNRLAGHATSLLAFDCEFWHVGATFLPREVGGYQLTRSGDSWTRSAPFFVVLPPPPRQLNRVSSKFATVTPATSVVLDIIEETERSAPEFLHNDDSVTAYFADPKVRPFLKPNSWLSGFMKMVGESTVVVKGDMDLKALRSACSRYGIAYHSPLRIFDIARSNPLFSKRCGTAKLDGTYHCMSKELNPVLKKAFPVGKAHNPVSDAAMTIQVAAWLAEKDMR